MKGRSPTFSSRTGTTAVEPVWSMWVSRRATYSPTRSAFNVHEALV